MAPINKKVELTLVWEKAGYGLVQNILFFRLLEINIY